MRRTGWTRGSGRRVDSCARQILSPRQSLREGVRGGGGRGGVTGGER